MPMLPGRSYSPKADDHMRKVLVRRCPACGAEIGEPCMMKTGKMVTKVTGVHSARFVVGRRKTTDAHSLDSD